MEFNSILKRAEDRKGGPHALQSMLPTIIPIKKLQEQSDDFFLAMMCKAINQAGFNWNIIEKKWPQFIEAFYNFDINKLISLSPDDWDAYTKDKRVVRNGQKIFAMAHNVHFLANTSRKHGGFGSFISSWPETDQIGLMRHLKTRGSRLGGQTSQWFLRYVGKDCFVITKDVVVALQQTGYDISNFPTSKKDLTQIQNAFNKWHEETNLPYSHLSKIAAYSVGTNYESLGTHI